MLWVDFRDTLGHSMEENVILHTFCLYVYFPLFVCILSLSFHPFGLISHMSLYSDMFIQPSVAKTLNAGFWNFSLWQCVIFIRFCYVLINCNELSHSGVRKVNKSCGFSTIWALAWYVRGHLHLSEFLGWALDGAFALCHPKMAASHAQLSPRVQRIQRILSGTQAEVCKDIRQVNVSLIQIINVNVAAQVMLNVGLAGQLLNVSVHISYSHFVIISR